MNIAEEYLDIVERVSKSIALPAISEIHVAPSQENSEKSSKFGAMVLEDETVGLTYVDLNHSQRDLRSRPERLELIGCPPIEAARLYAGEAGWQRSLGMAAVNAISQYVLRQSGYELIDSEKTMNLLVVEPADRIGMVGYFPPLVDQIRSLKVPLTVIELDEKWLQRDDAFEVTLDATRLSECNKILCTGTILVNQTLDSVLANSNSADELYLIGPTVGCLPDPLFMRGVTAVGGRQVVDCSRFIELWRSQQHWRQATRRYTIVGDAYPGLGALLRSL